MHAAIHIETPDMKDYMEVRLPPPLDNHLVISSNAPQRYEHHRLRMYAMYVRRIGPSGNDEATV